LIEHLLTQTLDHYRPMYDLDAGGGQALTGYQPLGPLRCMVSQPSSAEVQDAAARWGAALTHVVHALADADVRRGDELGGPIPSMQDGERLRVIAVIANSRLTYMRIQCETVQAEPAMDGGGGS
jgi:hypothetical protein